METKKRLQAKRRGVRARAKIKGAAARPRLAVFSSSRGIFVQFIDDEKGLTLLSGRDFALKGDKTERAAALGKALAKKATELGIKKIVFDRGQNKYHGRLQALAEALRAGKIEF